MRKRLFVLLGFALALILALSPTLSSASSSGGFVKYAVSITRPNFSHSFSLRESVQPTNNPSLSNLILMITSGVQNFTYSRAVNSSSPFLFPYMILPANNQSISYGNGTYALTVRIVNSGSSSVVFNASKYQLTDYSATGTLTTGSGAAHEISGNIDTFPSSLIYSVTFASNGTSVSLELVSTNLPLDPASGAIGQTEAVAVSGLGVAVVAIAAFFGMKKISKRSKSSTDLSDAKPPYWVD